MKASQLRASILQQAVEGKLVPQIPEEGTAADLLESIRAEREALIKAGKIKKAKPLPKITEDEIPFEIPESWEWVKMDTISSKITDGEHKTPRRVGSYQGYYLLSARNISDGYIRLDDVDYVDEEEYYNLSRRCNPQYGDVLLSCSGSIGRCAVVLDNNHYVMVRSSAMISPLCVSSKYLMYTIQSNTLQIQIKKSSRQTAQANLFQEPIRNLLLPLPPLAEQKRIVAKLEELMPLIDAYEKEEEKLSALEKSLPEKLRRSVLQQAVEGKLVPQIAEEGTAAELLKEIEKERAELVKEGKMKKAKPLPDISEDEIPFEIPESWEWVRLGDVTNINGGFAFKSTNYTSDGIRVIRISDFNEAGFVNDNIVRHPYDESLFPYVLEEKNILLCMTGGTVGKSFFVTKIDEKMVVNQRVATIKAQSVLAEYVYQVILSPIIQRVIQYSKNSTNDNISMDNIKNFLIPLPPLAEQKRIVAKVEELMQIIDKF